MASNGDIMRLCRLCLVKDEVNIPIFDDHSSVQQIFMKISSCLPVTISKDDKLPKKICDGCSGKLDMLYQFWNTSAKAEKQLLLWLNQAGINFEKTKMDTNSSASEQSINKAVDSSIVKQENEDYVEGKVETSEISTEAKSYILQQQQLPYQKEFSFPEKDPVESGASVKSSETEEPPPKRARRAAAMKAPIQAIDSDDEDDEVDDIEPITKTEDESEDSGREEDNDPSFEPASVSADDQPGPSGVGKGSADASCEEFPLSVEILEYNTKPTKVKKKSKTYSDSDEDYIPSKSKKSKTKKQTIDGKSTQQKESKGKLSQCKKCYQEFSSKRKLRNHRKVHRNEKFTYSYNGFNDSYFCNVCCTEFSNEKDAENHVKTHVETYKCKTCDQIFSKLYPYALHLKTHSNDETFRCPLCDFDSSTTSDLQTHITEEHVQKTPFQCETCSKGFRYLLNYQEHQNEHLGIKPFLCIVCEKTFTYSKNLLTHQIRNHRVVIDGQLLPNQCHLCKKVFGKNVTLEKHVTEVHLKDKVPHEKKHLCDACGKGFSTNDKLKIHYRIHTGDKPYSCRYCSKSFTKKDYLVMHERIHSGEKPYACEYCGKCFNQAAPLRIHVRIHTGERPYVCQFCSTGFTSRGTLNIHYRNCSG